jgi:hypothetical protein
MKVKPADDLHPKGISVVCTLKGIKSGKLLNLALSCAIYGKTIKNGTKIVMPESATRE